AYNFTVANGECQISSVAAPAFDPNDAGGEGIEANSSGATESDTATLSGLGEVNVPDLAVMNVDGKGGDDLTDNSFSRQRTATPKPKYSFRGVSVTATNKDDIEAFTVSIAGGTVGIAISAAVNVIETNTNAYIGDDAQVNDDTTGAYSNQSVNVAAGNDFYHLAVAGTLSGGVVAISPATAVTLLDNTTQAYIGADTVVNAKNDVLVEAHGGEDILVIGFGVAGGVVAVGGAVNVLTIDNITIAAIGANADVFAGGDVLVFASDDTDLDMISGALAGGFVGVGASVGVLMIDKDTQAYIGTGAEVDALGTGTGISGVIDGTITGGGSGFGNTTVHGVVVQAQSNENLFHLSVAGGGGFVGISGAVTVTLINSDTTAYIGANAQINQTDDNSAGHADQSVFVVASNNVQITSFAGAVAGGFVGIGGAVDVGSIKNDTTAKILGGAHVKAKNDVQVNAVGIKDLDGLSFSGAGGFVGLSASVSVWSIGTPVIKEYSNNDGETKDSTKGEDEETADADAASRAEANNSAMAAKLDGFDDDSGNPNNSSTKRLGGATGGAATALNNKAPLQTEITGAIDSDEETFGTKAFIAAGAVIEAGDNIEVKANEDVEVNIIVGAGAGGFVGIGAAMSIVKISANAIAHADGRLSAGNDIIIKAQLTENVDVLSIAGATGFVGLGAAVVDVEDISTEQAYIGDTADVEQAINVTIEAQTTQTLEGETDQIAAGAVGIGATFVRLTTTPTTEAYIGDDVEVGQAPGGSVDDIRISADADINVDAKTLGIAAGIGAATTNFAFVDIKPSVEAYIGDLSKITVNNDIEISATLTVNGHVEGLGASAGGIAVGAMIADVSLGMGNGADEVIAGVGNGTTIKSRVLRITTESTDDLLAESVAGSGSVLAGFAGSLSTVTNDNVALARIGDNSLVDVRTLYMGSTHEHDVDTKADSYALGLAAGTGAGAVNTITSGANIDIGSNNQVTADTIVMTAINRLDKTQYANDNNLRSGSASLGNVSVLKSGTEIGQGANPFEAVVDIGAGSELTVGGDNDHPGTFQIETLTDVTAMDSIRAESVSGFSITVAVSEIKTNTLAGINLDGATLENKSGDIYLTAKSDANINPSCNLFVVTALTGGAGATATSDINANNEIHLDNATIRGGDVHLFTGKNRSAVPNIINSFANTEITAMRLLPGIDVPYPNVTIDETNLIDIQGTSSVLALEDVELVAREGIGGDDRGKTDGLVLSISLIPYGVDVPNNTTVNSVNTINIGASALVESGINNKSLVHIMPLRLNGDLQIELDRLGEELNDFEKGQLNLDLSLKYEYALLNLDDITFNITQRTVMQVVAGAHAGGVVDNYYGYKPQTDGPDKIVPHQEDYSDTSRWENLGPTLTTEQQQDLAVYSSDVTQTFQADLDGKFYVIKPVALDVPSWSYVNVGNLLLEQRQTILGWMANHATNAEAIARYEVQLELLDEILEDLGLLTHVMEEGKEFVEVKKELDMLFVELPEIYASPGSIFIEADGVAASTFLPMVDHQLVARAGAEIDIFNNSPFTMSVNDTIVRDNRRVAIHNGEHIVLEPGNIYVNYSPLTSVDESSAPKTIYIKQEAEPDASYDLGSLVIPPLDKDIYVVGDVINEAGDLTIENKEGSIHVTGEIRAENVTIIAARDFNLNTDDWLHTNRDPRQYIDYQPLRNGVWNVEGNKVNDVFDDYTGSISGLDEAINTNESAILAQGRIGITARFLNINGLIQSGVETITLHIGAGFVGPSTTQDLVDDDGNVMAGVSFGSANVPVDAYFDAQKQAIVVDDVVPQGGKIVLAGQVLSTGNGEIKAAYGYTSVDIDNDSSYELILNRIDTTKERVGEITIVDTSRLQKVKYAVNGAQIDETTYQGIPVGGNPTEEDGIISYIDYAVVGTASYGLNDPIQYQPQAGLHYVWTEGQEWTKTTVSKYEKNSFNLFGDNIIADWLASDNSYKWRTIDYTQDFPLLESETREKDGTPEAPPYAAGQVYTIQYEQKLDVDIEAFPGITLVRDIDDNKKVYRYSASAPEAEVSLVRIVNLETGEVESIIDYPNDPNWEYDDTINGETFVEDPAQNKFDSDYRNYDIDVEPWTTGGGWLRKKTVHTLTTQIEGIKDYYTHTLRADFPIDISFVQGPPTQQISIATTNDLYIQGNINSPDTGTIILSSDNGSITSPESVAIYGMSPTITAGGDVLVNVEGDKGPLNVTAGGDITITAISLDNETSILVVGDIITSGGDVFLDAPDGIRAYDGASDIEGDRVELSAHDGAIGAVSPLLRVNSDILGTGGLAARAEDNIYILEAVGDLKLTEPESWDPVEASIISNSGDIYLETVSGSILDALYEAFTPSLHLGGGAIDPKLQELINAGTISASSLQFPMSPGLMRYLYPHTEFLGQTPDTSPSETPNIDGASVTLYTGGATSQVGRISDPTLIDMTSGYDGMTAGQIESMATATVEDLVGYKYAFYLYVGSGAAGVDLTLEDFGGADWQKIDTDFVTDTDRSGSQVESLANSQTVLVQYTSEEYGLYKYLGATASIDLTQEDYSVAYRWQKVTADHATDDGAVDLVNGEFIENRFVVEHLTLQVWDDVDVEASGPVNIDAGDSVAVQSTGSLQIDHIEAGGDVRLQAGGSITDLYTHAVAAISNLGDLILISGFAVESADGNDPLRIQIAPDSRFSADVAGELHIEQVADDVTIRTVFQDVSDLYISRADAGGEVKIEVKEGDMLIGKVLSGDTVNLRAEDDIFDAYNDSDFTVVNIYTADAPDPATGDVYMLAGGQIGQSDNFLDLDLKATGQLDATAGGNVYMNEVVGDMNIGVVESTAGDVELIADVSILDTDEGIAGNPAVDVIGNNIILTAIQGAIGVLDDDLDIDSAHSAVGTLTSSSELSTNIIEPMGDLSLNTVETNKVTAFIQALAGDILNANPGGTNITSGLAYMHAGQNIGEQVNPIALEVANLESKSVAGSTWAVNTGALTIGRVLDSGDQGMQAGGLIEVTATSPIIITEDVTAVGLITYTATDSSDTGDDISVFSGVAVESTGSSIIFYAGDDIAIAQGVTLQAAIDVELYIDYGSVDSEGGIFTIYGGIDAPEIEIYGQTEDDIITINVYSPANSLTGNTQIFSDAGDDLISIIDVWKTPASLAVYGQAGEDTILGSQTGESLYGGPDDDFIDAGAGDDVIHGQEGSDTIHGRQGDDTIYGHNQDGSGDDGAADIIYGGWGDDQLYGNAGDDYIEGGLGGDQIFGNAGNDTLDGGFGIDTLYGHEGDDVIYAGSGAGDSLYGGPDDDIMHGSDDGADIILGDEGRDRIYGYSGNDTLAGGDDDDIIEGGLGDDQIEGNAGSDVLVGQADHDMLYGHNNSYYIATPDDDAVDYLFGDYGTDADEADSGQDQLFGGGGNDLLYGEAEDDAVDPGTGSSDLVDYGEPGDDAGFTPPSPTGDPVVQIPDDINTYAAADLPVGVDDRGRWAEFAGSATGAGLSGEAGYSMEPDIVAGAGDVQYVAWVEGRNDNQEIYVARHDAGGWQQLAGSGEQGGVSDTIGSSHRPSISLTSEPIIAWTEIDGAASDIYVAQYDPLADGGNGDWVALGSSLGSGGISSTGSADNATVLQTSLGPVVAWLDSDGGTRQIFARYYAGGTWHELGTGGASGNGISQSASDIYNYEITTDGTKVAAVWTETVASLDHVYLREYDSGTWQELDGSASSSGVSGIGYVWAMPTAAYQGSDLFVAWEGASNVLGEMTSEIYAAYYNTGGGIWQSAGPDGIAAGGISNNDGFSTRPQLASGGGKLHLVWGDNRVAADDIPTVIYSKVWSGGQFVEELPGDADDLGISTTSGLVENIALSVDTDGHPYVVWQDAGEGAAEILVRGNQFDISANPGHGLFVADGVTSVQDILDGNDLDFGDVILIASGSSVPGFAVTGDDAGVTIYGGIGSLVGGVIDIYAGADDVTLQRVQISGTVTVNSADDFTLRESTIIGTVTLSGSTDSHISHNDFNIGTSGISLVLQGATGLVIQYNSIGGSTSISLTSPSGGVISNNDISADGTGIDIQAAFSSVIEDNDIHNAGVGVAYHAAAILKYNLIHDNTIGVRSTVSSAVDGFGFVAGSEPNEIYNNTTGVDLIDARMQYQHIFENSTGVTGSGILGGDLFEEANLIEDNIMGVSGFSGTIQYNRIAGNTVGLSTTSDQKVFYNLIYRNQQYGIQVSGDEDVRIINNTLYAPVGDNIHLENSSKNVEIRNNVLWAHSGYDIYVNNNSQEGYFSDYNLLHVSDTGKLGYWTKDFYDILDWQADITRYDLHSSGHTVVNPFWSEPAFINRTQDDYRLFELSGGLRLTSPTIDAGDPASYQVLGDLYTNLLVNPGFESGLTGWDTSPSPVIRTINPSPHEGSQYFSAGNQQEGYAEQEVDLTATYSAAELDSYDLVMIFGGRISAGSEWPEDHGTLLLTFRGAGGTISQIMLEADDFDELWESVSASVPIPGGTRSVLYRFEADRNTGGTNDSFLDHTFIYVVPENKAPDQGAYGNTYMEITGPEPHIQLRWPDLYTDWEKEKSHDILWDTYGNTDDLSVKIDLYTESADGPEWLLTIADAAPDIGQYTWVPALPAENNLDYNTHGLRIQVSLVGAAAVVDRGTETFSIPEEGTDYYVDDHENIDDDLTPVAVGSNRNTGKTDLAPKPNPANILHTYDLTTGEDVIYIDTGDYPLINRLTLSGTIDRGFNLDEGFVFTGPLDENHIVSLHPAIPGDQSGALIDLYNADFVTVTRMTLSHDERGIYVRNSSDNFLAEYVTSHDHIKEGFRIESDAVNSTFDNLIAYNNDLDGIYINASIAGLTNSTFYDNTQKGINLVDVSGAKIQNNLVYQNLRGIQISNSNSLDTAYVGLSNLGSLTDAKGNLVHHNTEYGIYAQNNVVVSGNNVYSHDSVTGIYMQYGTAEYNIVHDNATGILANYGTIAHNRIYNNTVFGIDATDAPIIQQNAIYDNPIGLRGRQPYYGSFRGLVENNLVYNNPDAAIVINRGASGARLHNNTIYQPAGDAVRIGNSSANVDLKNNIIWVADGYGITVSGDSQQDYQSNYNIIYTSGAGKVGQWQSVEQASLLLWQIATSQDADSLNQEPYFVNPAGVIDGILGYQSGVDYGRDDDFHIQSIAGSYHDGLLAPILDVGTDLPILPPTPAPVIDGNHSPAIDRGDLSFDFSTEPDPNGGFINIGAFGNTEQASLSELEYVLVVKPDGGETWPAEQTFPIRWRSDIIHVDDIYPSDEATYAAEISSDSPVGFWKLSDTNSIAVDASGSTNNGTFYNAAQDVTGWFGDDAAAQFDGSDDRIVVSDHASLKPADLTVEAWIMPETGITTYDSVLSKTDNSSWTNGYGLYYDAGEIIFFVNNYSTDQVSAAVELDKWTHVAATYDGSEINLYINGQPADSLSYTNPIVHTSNDLQIGQGYGSTSYSWRGKLDEVSIYGTALLPGDIADHFDAGTVNPTEVIIKLIRDGDPGFDYTITPNTRNDGELLWEIPWDDTTPPIPADDDYRIEITRTDDALLTDISNEVFSITPPIKFYYVNDDDLTDDFYTFALGNDSNDGLNPAHPKRTIHGVLAAYELKPGDTILVDTGYYTLPSNILITQDDAGVMIQGPTDPNYRAVLDRANTVAGSYVVELVDADGVALDHLSITGGTYGVYVDNTSDSDSVIVSNCHIYDNTYEGVLLGTSNDLAEFDTNTVTGNRTGIQVSGNDSSFTGNQIYQNSRYGIHVNGARAAITDNTTWTNQQGIRFDGTDATISNNTAYDNQYNGIYVYASGEITISQNHVFQNDDAGIYGYVTGSGNIIITDNRIHGHLLDSSSIGISIGLNTTAVDNIVYDNYTGIYANPGVIQENWVYANTIGIDARDNALVLDNTVYDNTTGIRATRPYYGSFYGQVENNLVYDNTDVGIILNYANANTGNLPEIRNNTVYQPLGDALHIGGDSHDAMIRNNILWADTGYVFQVSSDSQDGVDSDYNLLVSGVGFALANWGGVEIDNRADWFYELGLDGHSLTTIPDFEDIIGPDAIRGFSWQSLEAPQIIDDGEAGFSAVGEWTTYDTAGYGSDYTASAKGSGADVATWTFTGLVPDATYRISATWPEVYGSTYDALYRVLEDGEVVAARIVDQRYVPTDIQDGYGNWAHLALVDVSGSSLEVKLNDLVTYSNVVADAVRIEMIQGDGGEDDDFHLQTASAGIDAGDLQDTYDLEPDPNGERINIGAYGNTEEATASSTELVQVLSPYGLEKYEIGQDMRIWWHSAGLSSIYTDDGNYQAAVLADDPVAYYQLNESALDSVVDSSGNGLNGSFNSEPGLEVEGAFGSGLDQAVQFDGVDDYVIVPDDGSLTFDKEVSFSMWIKPQRLLGWQSLLYKGGGASATRAYSLYLYSNGSLYLYSSDSGYQEIHTSTNVIQTDQWYHIAGIIDRNAGQMSIYVNGQLEVSGSVRKNDMVTTAEPLYIGYDPEVSHNRFQGVIDEVAVFGKALSQTNLRAHLNAHVDRVDIDLLEAGTHTWVEDIATNVEAPRFFDWEIPGSVPADANYLVKVTAYQGGSPFGVSPEPFLIANDQTEYYVNIAGDTDFRDNDYANAAGDNRNTGKSADAPMSSLRSLLSIYDLDSDDIIYVDTGTYTLFGNLVIESQDAGVTIQGPITAGFEAVIDRANTAAGSYIFELINADGLTLDHLTLTGAEYGIYTADSSDSDQITISNCVIHDFVNDGIWLKAGNDQAQLDNNIVTGNRYGIYVQSHDSVLTGNLVYNNSNRGIYVTGNRATITNNTTWTSQYGIHFGGDDATISGNKAYDNTYSGIYVYASGDVTISQNHIFSNGDKGIYGDGRGVSNILITDNRVHGHFTDS
ncbi:MAG: hypothetical protein GY869_02815, partial [Planctomycetes bacterium]|nr:hypothetical protein [Planctomycetota bacterium]